VNVIIDELAQGRSVQFGTLGTFRLRVNSAGSVTADEVSAFNIKKAKILYRPGKTLQDRLKIRQFTKVT
jgi:nucleoid DNA-binding protein